MLEEDGYVDWGPVGGDVPTDDSYLTLYRSGATEGVQLLIRRRALSSHFSYEPYRKAYLISSAAYRDAITGEVRTFTPWPKGKPFPVWWLTSEGKTTEIQIPFSPFLESSASRGFLAVKDGIFAWSHAIAPRGGPGDAGGYLFQEGTIRKLITGMLHRPAISQDGCKVAFVHDPEFPTDQANRSTVKVKVIDLCEGGR